MKAKVKARIVLSTIALLGLASVSIAISKRHTDLIFVQQNQGSGLCNVPWQGATIAPGGIVLGFRFVTNSPGVCGFQSWVY